MVATGRMVSPFPTDSRMSTINTLIPSEGRNPASRGAVRHRRIIRSECSARLIQIFWPLTT